MKVGILTYHFSDNFGAVLQAYALRKWFLDRGHNANFINYQPAYVEQGGDFVSPLKRGSFRTNLKILYLKVSCLHRAIVGNKEQSARFEEFRRCELGIASKTLKNETDLLGSDRSYDLLVAGSDQIWNPSPQKGLDPVYFISFAKAWPARRISYAASFGKDSLPEEFAEEAGHLIKALHGISVREKTGLDIVRKVSGRTATCVPDPTLLHASYSALLQRSDDKRTGHIFCYALRTGEGVREAAEMASKAFNAPIISPYNAHRRWREIGETVYPGPADWLKQISQASCVITNSFHGTVFSIIFRRPFVVVGLPGKKMSLNARAKNLLAQLGLMDRFVEAEDLQGMQKLFSTPIDWESVGQKQALLREVGAEFLESEIKKVGS